jgi:hypothetical protein
MKKRFDTPIALSRVRNVSATTPAVMRFAATDAATTCENHGPILKIVHTGFNRRTVVYRKLRAVCTAEGSIGDACELWEMGYGEGEDRGEDGGVGHPKGA